MTEPTFLEPSIALAAYAEPLASNRRVLVFGNAGSALSLQLLERGARTVHVCDPDPVRVAEATARNRSTQITFSALADSDLSVRDGAFELALIENLGAFNALSILKKTHRALATRGVAVVACPNPEAAFPLLRTSNPSATALDYYALYDAVAAEFEHVRMLGQTPFVGYAIADFSASGDPEPALDTSFVPGGAEEPDLFIALASGHEVRLDEFAVIQLPTKQLLTSADRADRAKKPEKTDPALGVARSDARELARLKTWIGELEARASTADERADHAETELEELRAKLAKLEADGKVQEALKSRHDQELPLLRAELKAKQTELGAKQTELSAKQAELTRSQAELSSKQAELLKVRTELGERDRQLVEQANDHAKGDLTELERQLAERGAEVRRLEQELRTAERTGRELVRELERSRNEHSAAAGAELERAIAEREADLQAAAWTIESLSLRLELAGVSPGSAARDSETPGPNP